MASYRIFSTKHFYVEHQMTIQIHIQTYTVAEPQKPIHLNSSLSLCCRPSSSKEVYGCCCCCCYYLRLQNWMIMRKVLFCQNKTKKKKSNFSTLLKEIRVSSGYWQHLKRENLCYCFAVNSFVFDFKIQKTTQTDKVKKENNDELKTAY